MTVMPEKLLGSPAGVSVVETPEGLNALKDKGCAAAVWKRPPAPELQSWINRLSPDLLPRTRVTLRPQNVRAAITAACEAVELPDSSGRQRLISDVVALSDHFCNVMDPPFLRLRLDKITTNACRKFHIDALTARLVCTYRGTGTQYGISHDGSDPDPIFTVPTGAPILLRGTLWPEQPRTGLLHRSPPIEGSGETRLVLVLDPVFDPEDGL